MTTASAEISGHLLVVDDDREICDLLRRFLGRHGFRVSIAGDGREMQRALKDWKVDLVILDLMLPGEDGLTLCRDLRAASDIPVLMLTVIGSETDRIIGLEMGADDYLAKPFNPRELLARIRAILRRAHRLDAGGGETLRRTVRFQGWALNIGLRRLVSPQGLLVDLSAGEFGLLVAFLEHPQRVLSRDQLLDLTHGRIEAPFDRSVDMQVSRLRRKIETDPSAPALIRTVRGGGYLFAADVIEDVENAAAAV